MKKIRYLPFGYTIRNGHTVVEQQEADIVRNIFKAYIQGASLKEIAEDLTAKQIPYTERTCVWDKARISRILENAKYTGDEEFETIIDENIYEEAAAVKSARRWNQAVEESEGIRQIRDRIRCGQCGATMLRHINSKRAIRESWTCSNADCGIRVRISDGELLRKITLLMNRVIANADLMLPHPKIKHRDSAVVLNLQQQISDEMEQGRPSEERIVALLCEIAGQLYKETNAKAQIAAQKAAEEAARQKAAKAAAEKAAAEAAAKKRQQEEEAKRQQQNANKNNNSSSSSNNSSSSNSSSNNSSSSSNSSSSGYLWPLSGYTRVSSPFGYRNCPYHGQELHGGCDVPAPSGTPIRAAKSGVVVISTYGSSYGNYVVIAHSDGSRTMYAHQSQRAVSAGQTVSQGQTIGYVGSTGNSTGSHLHFELWLSSSSSSRVNPVAYCG